MQARIHQLSAYLASQIAAGEVVERPASVLKELLENSIDAGSRQINVSIENGGLGLIAVQDDGQGIVQDDLALALTAHATSKITQQQDLEAIISLGFRGEALASIASVAEVTLQSRPLGSLQGWKIHSLGEQQSIMPAACAPGTYVEIRDLFYNTPARRKFLKSEKTELLHLEEVFKRIALSHFEIGFQWTYKGRTKKLDACTKNNALSKRLAPIYGASFIEQALYVEAEQDGIKIWGWISSKEGMRAHSDLQNWYVNGRMVRDRLLLNAARQVYQEVVMRHQHSAYLLYLELNPRDIDVNVHPTKHEVRFHEARFLYGFIAHALKKALQEDSLRSRPSLPSAKPSTPFLKNEFYEQPSWAHVWPRLASGNPTEGPAIQGLLKDKIALWSTEQGFKVVDIKGLLATFVDYHLQKASCSESLESRPLLIPLMVAFKVPENQIEALGEYLQTYGFTLGVVGPGKLRISKVPAKFSWIAWDEFFKNMLLEIQHHETVQQPKFYRKMVDFMSNFEISLQQSQEILEEVLQLIAAGEIENLVQSRIIKEMASLDFRKIFF